MSTSLAERVLGRFTVNNVHPALSVDGVTYSYATLGRMSDALAAELLAGAGPLAGRRIGLAGTGSLSAYLTVLASLRLGATYVPLDLSAPDDRLEHVLVTSAPAVVVMDPRHHSRLPLLARHAAVLDPLGGEWVDGPADQRSETGDDVYVLFTSGSTGQPKGIGIPERCVLTMFDAMTQVAPVLATDVVAQSFELTFDLAQYSTLAAWSEGAHVAVLSATDRLRPVAFVRSNRVSYWFSVPTVAALAEESGDLQPAAMPSVRVSLFCGEALPTKIAGAWSQSTSGAPLWNLYGPTEATIACAAHRVDPDASDGAAFVPLGEPFPGTRFALRTDKGGIIPVEPGGSGELLIGGTQLFTGYLRAPDQTRAAFLPTAQPECTRGPERGRWYRSGDRVRVDDVGRLMYLGRTDDQVQVRGHRVELKEVEIRLASALDIPPSNVAAVAIEGPEGMIDYLGVAVADRRASIEGIRDAAVRCLPDYMVPRVIKSLPNLPTNSNGKTDRNALRPLLTQE